MSNNKSEDSPENKKLRAIQHYKDLKSQARLYKFAEDILNPDRWGFAVSKEVRNAARAALGIDFQET